MAGFSRMGFCLNPLEYPPATPLGVHAFKNICEFTAIKKRLGGREGREGAGGEVGVEVAGKCNVTTTYPFH